MKSRRIGKKEDDIKEDAEEELHVASAVAVVGLIQENGTSEAAKKKKKKKKGGAAVNPVSTENPFSAIEKTSQQPEDEQWTVVNAPKKGKKN